MTREISEFCDVVWDYYAKHGRDLPWRRPESDGCFDAYKILVSEIMLQQTQVNRVVPKYHAWLKRFQDAQSLADASLASALTEWNGLGYNRRAKFLHEAASRLAPRRGQWTFDDLVGCKGVGPNTAAAVLVYAYNQPLVFIETNIRTVFIHHFFKDRDSITDAELTPLVGQTLDREHPREWYWALMDYGSYLKATAGNASRMSKHYAKQSKFDGSRRQVRGQVLRLLAKETWTRAAIAEQIRDQRLGAVLDDLLAEGLISERGTQLSLGMLE